MKKLIYASFVALVLVSATSCKKYLDQVPDDRLNLEGTFNNVITTREFLNEIYRKIPDEYGQRNPGGGANAGLWTGGTDEAEYLWGFVRSNEYNIGSWDANSGFVGDYWRNYYQGIRAASIFMENAKETAVDMTPILYKQFKAEARALRAMFYFYLIRLYGPVMLMGESSLPVDAPLEQILLPRSTMDECVAYIVSELDAAIASGGLLEHANLSTNDYGRITTAAAYAYKAQALFLAASPLFNGNTDMASLKNEDGTNLISQTYDPNKWTIAANAYKDFINKFIPGTFRLYRENFPNGDLNPYLSTRNAIINPWNQEVIFARANSSLESRQYELTPYHTGFPGEFKGSGGLGATQNIVDAFFMANGKSIDDPTSGYVSSGFSQFQTPYDDQPREVYNQWVNREPRFYTNITFHNTKWLTGTNQVIITQLNRDGNSGRAQSNDYSPTGYIVRKGMVPGPWRLNNRPVTLFRVANVYLDYVEALNEVDPGNADILFYLNQIRERAGIPVYGSADIPVPAGQDEMRIAIRKERRVELAFENVRFFDVRRWKIAHIVDNGPIYGLKIEANFPDFLTVVPFENRVFNQRHYLFPIPQGDVNVNRRLVQNPGW